MDFYQVNEIENWTCANLMENYRSKLKLNDRKQILHSIKKDLEEVVGSISFDVIKKGQARKILDNWKVYSFSRNRI